MPIVNRRVTYKLYPDARQHAALDRLCDLHRGLTRIRHECPKYLAVNAQSAQVTLKRLDKAFAAFFRRVKEGEEEPGFPRFKSRDRFPGFGFKTQGDGFRFAPGDNWKHGRLRLSGIGTMQACSEARTPGRIVCADVQRKADGWFLSLVVECEPHREQTGQRECGLDWGVETFATVAYDLEECVEFPNDRLLNQESEAIKESQRALSMALRGNRSKRTVKAKRALSRRHRKVANRRKDMLHQRTAKLVREHSLIVTERLTIKNMTGTAKGTVENPGKRVKQKADLNRAILDTAPGGFSSMLLWKAEKAAGCEIVTLETRKHKPSQTDPVDGTVRKKTLKDRTHTLPNSRVIGRDQAAALSMLAAGLRLKGREPAWIASETPARAA